VKHKRYVLLTLLFIAPACGETPLSLGAADVAAALLFVAPSCGRSSLSLGVTDVEALIKIGITSPIPMVR